MPRPRPFTTVLTSLVAMLLLGAALLPIAQAEQSEAASRRIAAASLAVGTNFSCALQTSGKVRCWGTNSFDNSAPPPTPAPTTPTPYRGHR